MSPAPAFIRRICQAKQAELAGDRAIALLRLNEAAQLTGETDDQLQLAAWRKRLEAPAAPARQRKTRI